MVGQGALAQDLRAVLDFLQASHRTAERGNRTSQALGIGCFSHALLLTNSETGEKSEGDVVATLAFLRNNPKLLNTVF